MKEITFKEIPEFTAFAGLSIVLHELGHKFVALSSGFSAVYHANYGGLGLGALLRYFGMPLFFIKRKVQQTIGLK